MFAYRRHRVPVAGGGEVRLPVRRFQGLRARGVDYGCTNPFCCLWGAKLTDDMVVVYRVVYQAGLTPAEQAELIVASEERHEMELPLVAHLDPSMWNQYTNVKRTPGVPPKSIASDYAQAGIRVVKAINDRLPGVALVREALRVSGDGMPRLLVYDTCSNLIKQLAGLPRSRTNPEDVNAHAEDHAYDALRYLLFGLLGRRNTLGDSRRTAMPRPVTAGIRNRAF